MCPSYRATGEEQHSTRGRARLLFEMANGEVITGGWRSPEVAEALDLCLSCKGCKRDCPVGVDMAAYKTEFLAQRYRWRPRPASHYSDGRAAAVAVAGRQAAAAGGRRAQRAARGPLALGGEAAGRDRAGARDPRARPRPHRRPPSAGRAASPPGPLGHVTGC